MVDGRGKVTPAWARWFADSDNQTEVNEQTNDSQAVDIASNNSRITALEAAAFIDQPDETDYTDGTYFYFGWEDVGGTWQVQRQLRADGTSEASTTGFANLTLAWPNRATLSYS